jgi:hypothetical protein
MPRTQPALPWAIAQPVGVAEVRDVAGRRIGVLELDSIEPGIS